MLQSSCGGRRNRWQVSLSFAAAVNVQMECPDVVSKEAISSLTIWLGMGLRRPVFYADPKQFEKTQELVNNFLPCLRSWLEAIVKAANFMDEDAMGVDLQDLLRVQNHVILTRRSLQQAMGTEVRRLTSLGIVFNFEELSVHDDEKRPLENFQDVFQQFIGLHPGIELAQREDEEDPQMSMHLLEGLNEDVPCELRRQRLLRTDP
eukprot:s744_g14.t1